MELVKLDKQDKLFAARLLLVFVGIYATALMPKTCGAQASRVDDIIITNFGGALRSGGSLTVTVCTSLASGLPCFPKATIYTDATAGTTAPNPFSADSNGNYGFWVSAGTYVVSITGAIPAGYTKIYTINSFGNGLSQAYLSPTGPVTGLSGQIIGGQSSFSITKPDFYISRLDSTVGSGANPPAGCTAQVLFSPCDEPVTRIDFSNRQTTGVIPNMVGLSVVGNGFASNTQISGFQGNFQIGIGALVTDAGVPNTVHLRATNQIVLINGLPNQLAGGGNSRSLFGSEYDVNNGSGADAIFNGTIGNYSGGISLISAGANNSVGLGIDTASTTGKGWLSGIIIAGALNCGLCVYQSGSGGGTVNPVSGIHVSSGGAYGVVVGSGTITEPRNPGNPFTNPTTIGLLLDAKGTAGNGETTDSNPLVIRAKTASAVGSDYTFLETGTDNFLRVRYTDNLGNGPYDQLTLKAANPSTSAGQIFSLRDNAAERIRLENQTGTLTGTKLVPVQIQFGSVVNAGDLEIGSRGNVASNILFYTSPDAGTTGLVERMRLTSTGALQMAGILVGSLPSAASNPGAMFYVTDSTTVSAEGQTCVGVSNVKALAFSNGSVWKCF